jgi:ABC-2 type transport system ATP-binding protein
MNIIEVKNLTKRFSDKLVLDNISLKIEEGEIFGLLGPNGAGKSTLINLIIGLIKADNGDVFVGGHSINKEPIKVREQIGVVPQEIALFESLNAKENLEYWGGLYGLKGAKLMERIDEAISIAGLEDNLKKRVKTYSGGMKRRLNVAAGMMHHPKILIMDEPTVGVDPQSRNHIFQVVKDMNKNYNTTIIYTSHYM